MVLLGLSAEACDHVSGDAAVRNHAPDLLHSLEVPFAVVFSSHLLQHDAAAGLYREMDVLADVLVHRHSVDHLVADVLRVRSREAYAEFGAHLRHHLKKLGEVYAL